MNRGGFFHDSPGEPSPRRRFPVAAMSAPGIEHGRVSAFMGGSMRHMNRYTQEVGYHQARIAPCYTKHTNDRLDTGMTPEDREARRPERVTGMPRPVPVAGWRRGRGIGRKEAGFLHLEIEIEGHLRRFKILFLYAIVFRLL